MERAERPPGSFKPAARATYPIEILIAAVKQLRCEGGERQVTDAELASHAYIRCVASATISDDLANMYNTTSRLSGFAFITKRFPHLKPLFRYFYGVPRDVWFGGCKVPIERVPADADDARAGCTILGDADSTEWLRSWRGGSQGCGGATLLALERVRSSARSPRMICWETARTTAQPWRRVKKAQKLTPTPPSLRSGTNHWPAGKTRAPPATAPEPEPGLTTRAVRVLGPLALVAGVFVVPVVHVASVTDPVANADAPFPCLPFAVLGGDNKAFGGVRAGSQLLSKLLWVRRLRPIRWSKLVLNL